MEEKEFPKPEVELKKPTFSFFHWFFIIPKLILGICLLPFVYSFSVSFLNQLRLIEVELQNFFWAGLISFLIIYLFVYEPLIIYQKGQKLCQILFRFFAPLVKVAPYLLPVYFIILFLGYLFYALIFKSNLYAIKYFIFLFSFSLGLHLIFTAKVLRAKKDFLRINYLFGFSFIYILNIILFVLCLDLITPEVSFVNFFQQAYKDGIDFLYAIFKQLFLR